MSDPASKVVHHVLSHCRHVTRANVGPLMLDGDPSPYMIAASVEFVDDDDDNEARTAAMTLVFNAPASTPHVFITVTDGDPRRIGKALAQLERHERQGVPLSLHDHVVLDHDDYLAACDKVAILLLPASDSYFLRGVPATLTMDRQERRLLYATLVNAMEVEILRSQGAEALLDASEEAGRWIVSVDDGLSGP